MVWSSDLVFAIRDRYPVTQGHTLVIPRRHVEPYFDASAQEQAELWRAVEAVKAELDVTLAPDGHNVGFNVVHPALGRRSRGTRSRRSKTDRDLGRGLGMPTHVDVVAPGLEVQHRHR